MEPKSRGPLPFCDPFDAAMAESGPPAIFTLDADGRLRLDADRSRDAWTRIEGAPAKKDRDCLFRDTATGWVQYVLVGAPELCAAHPRADIAVYNSVEDALDALARCGQPPVWRGAFPPAAAGRA